VRQLVTAVQDVRSELRDVRETTWGDAGLVTCWLEQDYTLEGTRQHISAPTSAVLRRDGAGWRIVLFHSIPLPEAAA
jgi:ketosteroid isomerase-like protein